MFIATNHLPRYSSLREERSVFSRPVRQVVALLRSASPNSVTSDYKHLAPLGRNPTSTYCTSNLNSRMTNGKSVMAGEGYKQECLSYLGQVISSTARNCSPISFASNEKVHAANSTH